VMLGKQKKDFTKITTFSTQLIVTLVFVVVGLGVIQTFALEIDEPLIEKFGFSQFRANYLIAYSDIGGIVIGPIWGLLIRKYNHITWVHIASFVLMICGCFLLSTNNNSDSLAWASCIVFFIGLEWFFSSSLIALYILSPLNCESIVMTLSGIFYFSFVVIFSLGFGILRDNTGNYNASFIFLGVLCIVCLILSIVGHVLDVKNNGVMHRGNINE